MGRERGSDVGKLKALAAEVRPIMRMIDKPITVRWEQVCDRRGVRKNPTAESWEENGIVLVDEFGMAKPSNLHTEFIGQRLYLTRSGQFLRLRRHGVKWYTFGTTSRWDAEFQILHPWEVLRDHEMKDIREGVERALRDAAEASDAKRLELERRLESIMGV